MATTTVVTPSRGRPRLLKRAIESVQAQTVAAEVVHLVAIDDCHETRAFLEVEPMPDSVAVLSLRRGEGESTGPARAARVRNEALRHVRTEWVAFLDEDNEFHPAHLAELLALARERSSSAVHSYRELRNADGTPYVAERDPWCEDEDAARRSWLRMVEEGILTPGSCIMKDAALPDGPRSVDTSEWLLATSLARAVRFRETYSAAELSRRETEDDFFARDLLRAGVRIESTRLPTLVYYLGGYSTVFGPAAEWRP